MKLLIDIGNTCLKWATWQAGQLSAQQRITPQSPATLAQQCQQQWAALPMPTNGIFISSVGKPDYTEIIHAFCQTQWGLQPYLVPSTATACGVRNAYAEPHRLGVDRWLACIGGWFWSGQQTCCVVDCGTAMTVDVVTADGQHQGGLILPGVAKMHQILAHDTHALGQYFQEPPPLSVESPLLAKNSQHAIQLGIYYAIVGVIEHVMRGLADPQLPVLMTGGSAASVLPALPSNCHLVPNLVLYGLLKVSETT